MYSRAQNPRASRAVLFAVALALLAGLAGAADEPGPGSQSLDALTGELRVTGMTFVGSRGDVTEFVLRAREALLRPETNIAELEDVRVNGSERDAASGFEMSCQRGELDVHTNDFLAEGDVRGTTADGRSYAAPWVRYDHEQALLYTDAPATMKDATGTFSGDGFRYHLKEDRFRLLGNVKVVQSQ